jgi:hypothetical protein
MPELKMMFFTISRLPRLWYMLARMPRPSRPEDLVSRPYSREQLHQMQEQYVASMQRAGYESHRSELAPGDATAADRLPPLRHIARRPWRGRTALFLRC